MNIQLFAQRLTQSCHDSKALSYCTVYNRYECPFYQNVNPETTCRGITVEQWLSFLKSMTQADGGAATESDHDAHTARGSVLLEAHRIINGERQDQYGRPENNFRTIAEMWSLYLDVEIQPQDVALMMHLLKVARIISGTDKRDSYIDACGYLALAADMAKEATDDA